MPGNVAYINEVLKKVKDQHQGVVGGVVKMAVSKLDNGKDKINDLLTNLGNYDHCSKLIYYEEVGAKEGPTLLSGSDFKKTTLKAAVDANGIRFQNIDAKAFFGIRTFFKWIFQEESDFKDVMEFLGAAHGVLPYASESTLLTHLATYLPQKCHSSPSDFICSGQHAAAPTIRVCVHNPSRPPCSQCLRVTITSSTTTRVRSSLTIRPGSEPLRHSREPPAPMTAPT